MDDIVNIYRGTTSIYIHCLQDGKIVGVINKSIVPFLKQYLTEYKFDVRTKRNTAEYFYYQYEKTTGILYMPANILYYLELYFDQQLIKYQEIETDLIDSDYIDINSTGKYQDRDYQSNSISRIIRPGMHALELQTGCLCGSSDISFLSDSGRQSYLTLAKAYQLYNEAKVNPFIRYFKFIPHKVSSLMGDFFGYNEIEDIVYSGRKSILKVIIDDVTYVICTLNHAILTEIGWIEAQDVLNQMVATYSVFGKPIYRQAIDIKYLGQRDTYDIRCKEPHCNFIANGVVVHNSGKTYIAVRAITEVKKRTLIVLPASLMKQWYDAIYSMCDASVTSIRGSKAILDIMNDNYECEFDVLLASINTMRDYINNSLNKQLIPQLRAVIEKLKIGMKIIDECHLNFNANTLIDIMCGNIEHNIYLSATYIRNSRSSNLIFKRVFPEEIKYDGDREYEKYVNITQVDYSFGYINDRYIKTKRGYSQFKYEKMLLKDTAKLNKLVSSIMFRIIDEYYMDIKEDDEKLLILVGTHEFGNELYQRISNAYDLNVETFVYGDDVVKLEMADVIISTLGSCGTGRDIPNLRTMILFISFNSDPATLQTIGRLRKMKNTPEFIYLVNQGLDSHRRHADLRQRTYKFIGKSFKTRTM